MPSTQSRPIAPVYHDVLDMIGNTPMLEATRLDAGPCSLFLKLECMNPGNSIKDRIAVSMIREAEASGELKPGGHIVEGTAGNTGIALSLVARSKGYSVTVVVPDKMSEGKISHLRAMGARVVLTRSDVAKGHPEYYQDVAARLAKEIPGAYFINQFANEANPLAHSETTGPEIWQQMDGRIDAIVIGVGSGGTMSGIGRYLRSKNPEIDLILADPEGSILTPLVNEGRETEPGAWLVEGIGEDFVPSILDLSLVSRAYAISDCDSFHAARELLKAEGMMGGSSTGTLIAAALRYCREQTQPKRVVTFVCDSGAKYTDKMYNDFWMIDHGFIDRPQYNDLRDLISRRHEERQDHVFSEQTPVLQATKMMRLYGISQAVVLDPENRVCGIVDESDILLAVHHDPENFHRPVGDFMTRRLETLPPTASINDLLPIFRADRVAIVADADGFYGIITRIDLVNHLRTKLF